MNPQLETIAEELRGASERLRRLTGAVPEEAWTRRPEPGRWSPAECVAHLNLTSAAYLPLLEEAIEEGRRLPGAGERRYRRDPIGWLLWKTMGPPARMRVKTTAPFIPEAVATREELTADFERLQAEQLACVEAADGLPLDRIRIRSPFDPRMRYNLYAALTILPRHQHRHLWQAERAAGLDEELRARPGTRGARAE
jgi:hypothetical protein